MFGEGLKRACLSAARQSAQPFGQVSTTRHMDTNRDNVKDCNSKLPMLLLALFRCFPWLVLAVSAMADEVAFLRPTDAAGATPHFRKCPRRTRQTKTAFIGSLVTVFGKRGRISCTQTCGAQGPPGRAQSQPPSCGKATGLHCSILLTPGNLKPLRRSHWSI